MGVLPLYKQYLLWYFLNLYILHEINESRWIGTADACSNGDLVKNLILIDVKNCVFFDEKVILQSDELNIYASPPGIKNFQDKYIIAGYTRIDDFGGNVAKYSIIDQEFNFIEDYEFQIKGKQTWIEEVVNVGDSLIIFVGTTVVQKGNGRICLARSHFATALPHIIAYKTRMVKQ